MEMAALNPPRRKCKGYKKETPELDHSLSDAFKIYPELSKKKEPTLSWPIPGGNARPVLDYSPVKITPISKQEMFQRYLEYYGVQQIISNSIQKLYLDHVQPQHFEEVFLQTWRSSLDVGMRIEESQAEIHSLKQRIAKLEVKRTKLEKLQEKMAQQLKRREEKEAQAQAKAKPAPKIDIPVGAGDAKSNAKSGTPAAAVPESVKSKDTKKQGKQGRAVSARTPNKKNNNRNLPRHATS